MSEALTALDISELNEIPATVTKLHLLHCFGEGLPNMVYTSVVGEGGALVATHWTFSPCYFSQFLRGASTHHNRERGLMSCLNPRSRFISGNRCSLSLLITQNFVPSTECFGTFLIKGEFFGHQTQKVQLTKLSN